MSLPVIARRIFKRLGEMTDVEPGATDGQVLAWNQADGLWKPAAIAQSPIPDGLAADYPFGTITIAGDSYQFPLNRALPVTVINGIATFHYYGESFEFPVGEGGPGAPAGTFDTDGILIFFTAHGTNWQFPATLLS